MLQAASQPASLCPSSPSSTLIVPYLFLVCLFRFPCPHCSPSLSNAVTMSPAVPPRLFIANSRWWIADVERWAILRPAGAHTFAQYS